MPQIQICPLGHRWDPTRDARADAHARWNLCPSCGQGVELFSLRDTSPSEQTPLPAPSSDRPALPEPSLTGYEILSLLGYGGMGVVYKARQVAHDRVVALKLIASGVQARPSDLLRFRTENQAISRVAHPHIVRVLEVGENQGTPFAAMEYMDRGNLRQAIAANPLPPRCAAELLALLSDAVQAAHTAGIIHRDLKPANVLLATVEPDHPLSSSPTVRLLGLPKLSDFGLAKQIDGAGANTRTGAVMGTPSYMAPEQAEGRTKHVGTATDIYSLGAILYECLTGQPPFTGETVMETLDQVRHEEPKPPSRLRPDVPRELETICLKCLQKNPADRYATAREMGDDLRRYLAGKPILAQPMPFWLRWLRHAGREPLQVALVGLSLAFLVLGVLLLQRISWGSRPVEPLPPPAPEQEVVYYAAVTRRWAALDGIHPLSEAEAQRRQRAFRFTRKAGLVERVEAIDWRGRPSPNHNVRTYLDRQSSSSVDRLNPTSGPIPVGPLASLVAPQGATLPESLVCTWEYQHDSQGHVQREQARDVASRILWTFQITQFTQRRATGLYTDASGRTRARTTSGATQVELHFSEDGLLRETRYLSGSGNPRPDGDGFFGRRFESDRFGLVRSEAFLDHEEQPMLHPSGYARIERTWNAQGDLLETAYFDLHNKSATTPGGTARIRTTYDGDGNPLRRDWLDLEGKITSSVRMSYDERGHLLSEENLGPEDRLVSRSGYARREYTYDNEGNCTRLLNLDTERKPTRLRGLGCEALAPTYDRQGRMTEIAFLDANGNPAPPFRDPRPFFRLRGDEARVKLVYNDRGQVIERLALGPANEPVLDAWGAARTTYRYNDDGRLTEEALFDRENKPTRGQLRFARRTLEYRAGHLQSLSYYDSDGSYLSVETSSTTEPLIELVLNGSPESSRSPLAARLMLKYDDGGNISEARLLGRDGRPVADAGGVAEVRTVYDKLGALSELTTFGIDGRPIARPDGVARTTWTVDELGNVTEVATFGVDGKLVVPKQAASDRLEGQPGPVRVTGVARHHRRFEGYNLVEETFFNAENRPTLGNLGYTRAAFEYGKDGQLQKSTYSDLKNKPVVTRAVVQQPTWLNANSALPDVVPRDVLVSYAGKPITCAQQFLETKESEAQGTMKPLSILRAGVMVEMQVPSGPIPRRSGGPFSGVRRETALLLLLTPGNLQANPNVGTWAADRMP